MTTADPFKDLVPLAALDALDGLERLGFRDHLLDCGSCASDLQAYEATAHRLALVGPQRPPRRAVRARLMREVRRGASRSPVTWLALAASLLMSVITVGAVRERASWRVQAEELQRALEHAEARVEALQAASADGEFLQHLVSDLTSRIAHLEGQAGAPEARARIVWNPSTQDATMMISWLAAAPAGKAYQVWVIAEGAPVPAGSFRVGDDGRAIVHLPRLAETGRARAFAVTLEPAHGMASPTGPMVLAGTVS